MPHHSPPEDRVVAALRLGSIAGRFSLHRNLGAVGFATIDRTDFVLRSNGAITLINRSNSNGSAVTGVVLNLRIPARKRVLVSNGPISRRKHGTNRVFHGAIRVIFRSPCTSLGPFRAIRRRVTHPVGVRRPNVDGTRMRGHIVRLLSHMHLAPNRSFTSQLPNRLSNNRHRHITVTHTLTPRPDVLVTSRPISTLSISVHLNMLGLLTHLRHRRGLNILCVARSVTATHRFSSRVVIVHGNRLMRRKPTSRIVLRPGRRCAGALVKTTPSPRHQLGRLTTTKQ